MIDERSIAKVRPRAGLSHRAETTRWPSLLATSLLLCLLAGGCGGERQRPEKALAAPTETVAEGTRAPEPTATETTPAAKTTPAASSDSTTSPPLAAQTNWPAGFTGSQACADCHQERFDAFQATDHSRSFRRPDLGEETSLKALTHEASRQLYRIEIDGDELHHLGWQTFDGLEQRLPIADATIRYVVGSGAFAKSYLFEDGDSLVQVPLSYYVSTGKYDMSPGYDNPWHFEFTREVNDQCLFCHVGILQRKDGNPNHVQIHELAIGCERCHGAGREHVDQMQLFQIQPLERSRNSKLSGTSNDSLTSATIVHPGKLDRQHVEALCAQCHLQGDVSMHPAGMDAWSFQPGQPLSVTKIEYSVEPEETSTTFVGHFDQMRSSACYQNTETLTCITCHDPHHEVPTAQRKEVRRQQCLSCHGNESCGVPLPRRLDKTENDCVLCHMPRSKTEVPHVSITNHRIAAYLDQASAADDHPAHGVASSPTAEASVADPSSSAKLPTPVALLDGSPPGSWQRERNEATALAIWYLDETGHRGTEAQGREVLRRLLASLDAGPSPINSGTESPVVPVVSEATTRAYLARLLNPLAPWRKTPIADQDELERLFRATADQARIVLRLEPTPTPAHETALLILGSEASQRGRFADAVHYYERLTKIRRDHVVWYNLGLAYAELGRVTDSAKALAESIRIRATFPHSYRSLSRLYDHVAPDRAPRVRQISELLENANHSRDQLP